MERKERRHHTREFKLEAVRLVRDRGISVAQAARDLDLHAVRLHMLCDSREAFVNGGSGSVSVSS